MWWERYVAIPLCALIHIGVMIVFLSASRRRGSSKVRQKSAWHIFGGHIIPLLSLRAPKGRSNLPPLCKGRAGWGRGRSSLGRRPFAFRLASVLIILAM